MKKATIHFKILVMGVIGLFFSKATFAQLNYWNSGGGGIYTNERVSIGPPSYPSDFNVQGTSSFNGMVKFNQMVTFYTSPTFNSPVNFNSEISGSIS